MNSDIYHIISNTHWDREWRFPFQRNRQMLVDMMDAVLEILEKEPDYRAFHLDSQSIVLKDYLEIKPQNRDRIIKLTRENRLLHGPWYILPEEFQVGGENLIRNLLLGHKISNQNGGVSKIGYSPFSWGQISQLPQIYKEFKINLIMFYRGINSEDSPKSEFLWIGADGTEMVSSRFSTMPRYNFYFYIYRPVIFNEGFYDVEYQWERGGVPFHFADREQSAEDYFIIQPKDTYYPENIEKQVRQIIADQADDFTTPHKIWMEGHDSSGPNIKTTRIIHDIHEILPEIDVRHSTLEEYASALVKSVKPEELVKVYGERRSSQNNRRCGNLFGYTTSARMYLKQANFDAERWIQYYAEPFNIFSGMEGRDINDTYPETSWELIIQNSAHDSIGGCSLNRIHEDMMLRYKQVIEISKGVFERSVKYLLPKLNTGKIAGINKENPDQDIFVTVVNPTNYKRSEIVELFVDVPKTLDQGSVALFDASGHAVELEILDKKSHQPVLEQMINRPLFFDMWQYRVKAFVRDIPGFGMKSFLLKPKPAEETEIRKERPFILENKKLKVICNPDGSLTISDRQSNVLFENTAFFVDTGDAGHAWVFEPLGQEITTLGKKATISWVHDSDLFQKLSIKHEMELPADLRARKGESQEKSTVRIEMFLTLNKNEELLRINIELDNQAESHRLRLYFPMGFELPFSFGEGQFDVVKRSTERRDTRDWIEQPMYDFPMHHFVTVEGNKQAAALLVDGLKEYEVLPDRKTLAVTLFRTFEYKINPSAPQDYSFEKGAQMLGKYNYRLAFVPCRGSWHENKIPELAYRFNYSLRAVQSGSLNGELGHQVSFLNVEPSEIMVSAIKKPENFDGSSTFIIRLYNPCDFVLNGTISLNRKIKSSTLLTLEEEHKATLDFNENSTGINLLPKKIITVKIELEK
jgi:mannosylglycerate hydrolase